MKRHEASAGTPTRSPIEVKVGSVTVKIYQGKSRGYDLFTLVYTLGGKRTREAFGKLEKAKAAAKVACEKIAAGNAAMLQISVADHQSHSEALRLLKPLGEPLHFAIKAYVAARQNLPADISLEHAIADFLRRHEAGRLIEKPVVDAVAELLDAKAKAGMSAPYLRDLRSHLTRLSEAFKTGIASIHARDLEKWLDGLGGGIKTRLNARNSLICLFGHCRTHGYLTRGVKTEAEETKRPRYKGSAPEILDPAELETLIFGKGATVPTDEARLYFVLGAFSGIRTSEILRLKWSDIILESGLIQIAADRSKTATRRLVPIADNLRAWLAPHADRTGPIFSRCKAENVALGYARRVLPRWPANALRHSYASYRLALIQDAGKLALEMGNSAAMVFRHYREILTPGGELVTADLARKWFGILPR